MGADSRAGRAAIAAVLTGSLPDLVAAATEAIWNQVPAYAASGDPALRADVSAHVESIFSVFLAGLAEGRQARRADFAVTRDQATRRLGQGISLADFLQAFHIGQLTLWRGVLEAARDDQRTREAALELVERIMVVIELGSTVAGEAYVEAQQHKLAERDRLRRDVVEDLLAHRTTFAGQKRSLLQAVGLGPQTRLVVASVTLTMEDPAVSRTTGPKLASAASAITGGLAALRQDEIVGVMPVPPGGVEAAVGSLKRVRADHGALAIGVSTVHAGLAEVPDAYAEAQAAREALGPSDGVLALPLLSAFDYLVLAEAHTARRLIRPQVRRFVDEDAAAGGALIATLMEYAASDLNAKTAAQRLHLHVNTAYYRLERIAERTGYDLRRLTDVVELLIAIRLLTGRPTS